jgi:hypothetical protein
MTIVYTTGDYTVTQVSQSLFVVAAERTGTLAYFDSLATAERRGHEMAHAHSVSLWHTDERGDTRLIASYRNPAV